MDKKYPMLRNPNALISAEDYRQQYAESIENPEGFWAEKAEEFISWEEKWAKVKNTTFDDDISIKWFEGAKLNACYNCVDRHLEKHANKTAIIWEGDNPAEHKNITYKQLHTEVCKFANVLKELGVNKGDVVTIYMPMIPEAAYAMLACARLGAIHSVVFGGFSPEALRGRIEDGESKIVITADEGLRGGKKIPLKSNVDEAIKNIDNIKTLVVKRTGGDVNFDAKNNFWYHELAAKVDENSECEIMDAEDPLFILYTSGSTGKPKGLVHTTGGYLLYSAITHKYIFDYQEKDVYWCTADIGWITGHSYIIYGPLANGATTLMFEGVPNYPDCARFWQVVDKHDVNQFYTAPTALRMLMGAGDDFVKQASRKSLRILGSVGEPINPEVWRWYYETVGDSRCSVVDTWWQTETGGFLIAPFPYATAKKAGSATLPFFGIRPALVDDKNKIVDSPNDDIPAEGNLCILDSWPGQARTIWKDHQRFIETYFKPFSGKYFSGDGAKRDNDGYYWITGRVDDVINVSGHRIGTAEIESALVLHENVSEAAVAGFNHDIKGQGIYAYVVLNSGVEASGSIKEKLIELCKNEIGGIAKPDEIRFVSGLPKTRSGKIMRRILRKIANGEKDNFGDTRTLVNPEIINELVG